MATPSALLRDLAHVLLTHAEALERVPEAVAPPGGLLSGPDLDRSLGISASTRNRLVRENALPFTAIGGRKRFDLAECRAALQRRGQKPALTEAANTPVAVDVAAIAGRLGLRRRAA